MKKNIKNIISYIVYIIIFIFCVISVICILYQKIFFPDNIPNIFGWKMFIVLEENIVDEVSKR